MASESSTATKIVMGINLLFAIISAALYAYWNSDVKSGDAGSIFHSVAVWFTFGTLCSNNCTNAWCRPSSPWKSWDVMYLIHSVLFVAFLSAGGAVMANAAVRYDNNDASCDARKCDVLKACVAFGFINVALSIVEAILHAKDMVTNSNSSC